MPIRLNVALAYISGFESFKRSLDQRSPKLGSCAGSTSSDACVMVKSPAKGKKRKKRKPAKAADRTPHVPASSDEESAQRDEVLATAEDDEVSQLLSGMDIEGSPAAPMESPVTPRSPADMLPEEQHAEQAAVVTTGEHPAEQQHAADATVAAAGRRAL